MSKHVRVRYQYNKSGWLVSTRPITTNHGLVDVTLKETELKFVVRHVESSSTIYHSEAYPTLAAVKKGVKTWLKAEGATFDAEFRTHTEHDLLEEISSMNWDTESSEVDETEEQKVSG